MLLLNIAADEALFIESGVLFEKYFFSKSYWGKALVAYAKAQQWKKATG